VVARCSLIRALLIEGLVRPKKKELSLAMLHTQLMTHKTKEQRTTLLLIRKERIMTMTGTKK
jgi:hypothetical protein